MESTSLRTALGALAIAALAVAACKFPSPSPRKRTLAEMRNAATALTAWLTDQFETVPEADTVAADWSRCPPIRHAELAAKVQPLYIRELPAEDGWRQPLEYCLDQENRPPRYFGIRSSGGDGRFEGPPYRVGSFPGTEKGRDLVWLNGYFVAWPEP